MNKISNFRHNKLVCIDSDGCVFDSMESKHRNCFGPQILNIWKLGVAENQVTEKWNQVNLYSETRGINRFKGLALVLKAFGEEDEEIIHQWTLRADTLSNQTLSLESDPALKRALLWSEAVNDAISRMPLPQPFDCVKESIVRISEQADIVVVSSTNPAALMEEWSAAGFVQYVSAIMSQHDGPKSQCIMTLIQKGYTPENIIMLGDAPGDYRASVDNDIQFFPICPRYEKESWKEFLKSIFPMFLSGKYHFSGEQEYCRMFLEMFT